MSRRSIAFVLPVYNEAGTLNVLYEALLSATAELADQYALEFLFIDDGSVDDSLQILKALRAEDGRVSVISFSRNFGHQMAVTAGLDRADADAVIVMDSDLQDPPKVAVELVREWERGAEVVYAQRRTRKDTAFKRFTAHSFYWLLAKVASIEIPRNTGDFRLLDRKVVLELRRYREQNRFVRGIVSHVGFRQVAVPFDRDARHAGATGYPLSKMVKFALDGIFGFSTVPLKLISRVGIVMSLCSLIGVAYVLGVRVLDPASTVPGWAFVTAAMFMLGGIQLVMLGVLGSYLGRVYVEVQRRPLYSVAVDEGPTRSDGSVEAVDAHHELLAVAL